MKQMFLIIIAIFILSPTKANSHKYYVSISEIAYNKETNKLEVGLKLFFDDLQQAIMVEQSEMINDPVEKYDENIVEYIFNHFSIETNDRNLDFKLVGFEDELEAVWVYFESEKVDFDTQWKIKNTLFIDLYPKQINIINFYPDKTNMKEVEGLLLNSQEKEGLIIFD